MVGNTILLLSPHTDDAELGCGATIAKLIREGKRFIMLRSVLVNRV